jgi:hypothetical protein
LFSSRDRLDNESPIAVALPNEVYDGAHKRALENVTWLYRVGDSFEELIIAIGIFTLEERGRPEKSQVLLRIRFPE